ncbi:MAG: glycoside hydrolase family 15 protein [Patescibacteria group bacterium]
MEENIKLILAKSRQVIGDVSLENGAIVAANTDKPYYPRSASNYHYVWPRDAAFICVAAQELDLKIQEPFFKWLDERPEDFKKESLIFQNYSTNGRAHWRQFQPDQAGAVLWAIWEYYKNNPSQSLKFESLIRRLADGLCNDWKGSYFFHNTSDLWESGTRKTSTKIENNHTYSLAACAKGLELADRLINNSKWIECAEEMRKKIDQAYSQEDGYFLRTYGKLSDKNIDASILGLVWPFNIISANDERMVKTVTQIEEKLIINNGGVQRFQFDYYDGEGTAEEGAGAWPILNFWLSIYWNLKGDQNKTEYYFNWVLNNLKKYNGFIPEQIFADYRIGVYPLAWSHAMFILAAKKLGKI